MHRFFEALPGGSPREGHDRSPSERELPQCGHGPRAGATCDPHFYTLCNETNSWMDGKMIMTKYIYNCMMTHMRCIAVNRSRFARRLKETRSRIVKFEGRNRHAEVGVGIQGRALGQRLKGCIERRCFFFFFFSGDAFTFGFRPR